MHSASGQQFSLSMNTEFGEIAAVISEVGGALRSLKINGHEFCEPGNPESVSPFCEGIVMAPWPNRLDGGSWHYQGRKLEVPITIHSQQNANHGLLVNYPYKLLNQTASKVTLSAAITPTFGYPFLVETTVTYELVQNGLKVTHTALNHSKEAAPYAVGAHPYFRFSGVDTGDVFLRSEAETILVLNERQIPVGSMPTANSDFDLRSGIRVADQFIDNDFTDLPRDASGLAHTYLTATDGRSIDIWQDEAFKHVVIFTPDFYFHDFGGPKMHAVAVEPQTAAANALNTGDDLLWLETGRPFAATWGVSITL